MTLSGRHGKTARKYMLQHINRPRTYTRTFQKFTHMKAQMKNENEPHENPLVRVLSRHLESDVWNNWETITHKKIGDNLRCYPIIVVYAVAIPYLWEFHGKAPWVTKFAAITWSAWLGWYVILTLIQTYSLFAAVIPDILGKNVKSDKSMRTAILRIFISLSVSVASGFFMIGAGCIAWLIYSHSPH